MLNSVKYFQEPFLGDQQYKLGQAEYVSTIFLP